MVKEAEQLPVEITRRSIPAAVILSMDEYRKLKSFAEAYEAFTAEYDLAQLKISDELFEQEQTTGRDVDLS